MYSACLIIKSQVSACHQCCFKKCTETGYLPCHSPDQALGTLPSRCKAWCMILCTWEYDNDHHLSCFSLSRICHVQNINASAKYWQSSQIYNLCLITADTLEIRARENCEVKGSLQEFFHIYLSPVANARRGQSKLPASHVKTVFQERYLCTNLMISAGRSGIV